MSLPFLDDLCRSASDRWPVTVLFASPTHFELARENAINFTPIYATGYRGLAGLARMRREFTRAFDLVVGVPQVPPRLIFALKTVLGARYSSGEAEGHRRLFLTQSVPKTLSKSILASQQELLGALGFESHNQAPHIRLTQAEETWSLGEIRDLLPVKPRFILGLHASSEKPDKRWPAERYGAVIATLKQHFADLAVLSFGSAAEGADAAIARNHAGAIPWLEGTGRWHLRQTAAMLQRCDLLLSGDTGLMHIAAAVGTRTLSIFGPTSPSRLAPRNNGGDFLRPATTCHPCYERNRGRCACILQIAARMVALKAAAMLNDDLNRGPSREK